MDTLFLKLDALHPTQRVGDWRLPPLLDVYIRATGAYLIRPPHPYV